MTKVLNRESLLAASADVPSQTVPVPEWGGAVIVRGMSAKELLAFQKTLEKPGGKAGEIDIDQESLAVKILIYCLFDADGNRLLDAGDEAVVQGMRGDVFQKLTRVAMQLNGYVSDAGNSSATPAAGSSSD